MPIFFFDTSAIVKRYVSEIGTGWVNSLVDPAAGHRLHLATITGVEVVAAIARRQRGGSLSAADAGTLLAQFRHEYGSEYLRVEVTAALIGQAMHLAETHALRGADAIQLAAALEVQTDCLALGTSLTLVSADAELNAAATTEGLNVDDPNSHP